MSMDTNQLAEKVARVLADGDPNDGAPAGGEMSNQYKAPCGCVIHLIQWSTKRKLVSTKWCTLHGSAKDLLSACKELLPEGWDDGAMDHMPGVKKARLAIAKAEGTLALLEVDEEGQL